MLPDLKYFKDCMKLLKVKLSDRVVLYNTNGTLEATRAYFMFTAFGHKNVSILNGGLKKWTTEGRKTETCPNAGEESDYDYKLNEELVRNIG